MAHVVYVYGLRLAVRAAYELFISTGLVIKGTKLTFGGFFFGTLIVERCPASSSAWGGRTQRLGLFRRLYFTALAAEFSFDEDLRAVGTLVVAFVTANVPTRAVVVWSRRLARAKARSYCAAERRLIGRRVVSGLATRGGHEQ